MIDHVAHPSYDAAETHRFYTNVLGARLKSALTGDSAAWNARYLLAAYELEGAELDFFTFDGIVRPPPDGLPEDIRHVGITLPTVTDVARMRARLEQHAASYWVERHDGDEGEHIYVRDPNGLLIELSVAEPPQAGRADAVEIVDRWIAASTEV